LGLGSVRGQTGARTDSGRAFRLGLAVEDYRLGLDAIGPKMSSSGTIENNFVDSAARAELLCVFERFLHGQISNAEFIEQIYELGLLENRDVAVAEISNQLVFAYDNPCKTFYFTCSVDNEGTATECIKAFLRSDQVYKWPKCRISLRKCLTTLLHRFPLVRCLFWRTTETPLKASTENFDELAWPFCTIEEFEAQKTKLSQ